MNERVKYEREEREDEEKWERREERDNLLELRSICLNGKPYVKIFFCIF